MSMAFIVYIASISESVHTVGYLFIATYLTVAWFTVMTFVMNMDEAKKEKNLEKYEVLKIRVRKAQKYATYLTIIAALNLSALSLYPDEQAIYKIAGVSAQEKANIDAVGNVIQIQQRK